MRGMSERERKPQRSKDRGAFFVFKPEISMTLEITEGGQGQPKEISPKELVATLKNDRRSVLIYDIETMPAPEEVIRTFFKEDKVKLPKHPGTFDASSVKYGNMKDPKKKDEKLQAEMAKHRQALASYIQDCEQAKRDAWDEFVAGAALSPTIGRVLAVGYGLVTKDGLVYCLDVDEENERNLLRRHWAILAPVGSRGGKVISFNGHRFDYPFMRRRSWAYDNVEAPNLVTKYRKMEDAYIDALEEYRTGGSWSENIKLDDLGKLMGIGGKTEGMTGDLFYETWKSNPEAALDYLARDVELTYLVAQRMGIIK